MAVEIDLTIKFYVLFHNQIGKEDSKRMEETHNGCGRTRRVNWVYFWETWLKILNNLTRLKVGYNKTTGLHFMSGRTEMGYEVG